MLGERDEAVHGVRDVDAVLKVVVSVVMVERRHLAEVVAQNVRVHQLALEESELLEHKHAVLVEVVARVVEDVELPRVEHVDVELLAIADDEARFRGLVEGWGHERCNRMSGGREPRELVRALRRAPHPEVALLRISGVPFRTFLHLRQPRARALVHVLVLHESLHDMVALRAGRRNVLHELGHLFDGELNTVHLILSLLLIELEGPHDHRGVCLDGIEDALQRLDHL
mmetsp:Transcript_17174/g.56227  ORF Transcript_17174/g.56227 Transcript_17174/m.56227 type:complete len:228 (-) Transcript_17174:1541-2224(-)